MIKKMKTVEKSMLAPYSADALDPFTLTVGPLSVARKIQVALMTVTVLPLRLLLMSIILFIAWGLGVATLWRLPDSERRSLTPLSGWRRRWTKPFIVGMARVVFVIGGWHWIPQKGKRASAKEAPLLLLMPHSSFLDTIPVTALGCPCLVVKDTTEKTPLFGDLVNYTQPVFVDRESADSRRKSADEIMRRVRSGQDWEQILMFPEGACGNRKAILQFKLGGFLPGVAVQPVFIRYNNDLDSITWTWNGPGALKQLWLTLTQFRIRCELEFLPVYAPSQHEKDDPRLFAYNVRNYVSRWTGTPITHFSAEDVRFLQEARKAHLPGTASIAKLMKLRKKIGHDKLNPTKEVSLLTERSCNWKQKKGNTTLFAHYLQCQETEALKDFFQIMTQNCQDVIDVRIYAAGVCLLNTEVDQWTRIKDAFQVFGSQIGEDELAAILLLWWGLPKQVAQELISTMDTNSPVESSRNVSYGKFKRHATVLRKIKHTRSVS